MSEHERETAFLRRIIQHGESDACRKLEKQISQIQCDQRSVLRVALVTGVFLLLAMAGIAYEAIFQENVGQDGSELVFRLLCEVALASLISLAGFGGLLIFYRMKLNHLREECRKSVQEVLESRLSKPNITLSSGGNQVSSNQGALQIAGKVGGPS